MSLEIVDLDESSNIDEIKSKAPSRTYDDLPYLRKDFIQLMKPLNEKIVMQQNQINIGNEQIQILLRQLSGILNERARLFRRIGEIKGFFNDKQNKRYKPVNMSKKEAKAKLDKCDNILETTINQKDLIKADALNNRALFAQQKILLSSLENEYKTLSSIANNSVNSSVKEKIADLNIRLENFHTLTNEEFQEKLNLMELERNSLLIKLMQKEKQEEKARQQYKNYIRQQKNDELEAQKDKHDSRLKTTKRDIDYYDEKTVKNKSRLKTTKKDNETMNNRRIRHRRNAKRYEEEEEYNEYQEEEVKNYRDERRHQPRAVKRYPQTTRDLTRTRKHSNRRAYNADSENSYDNNNDNYQFEIRKTNRTKRKSKSPKPQNIKKILDEQEEERQKIRKTNRSKSATVRKKKEEYRNDDFENGKNTTKKKSNINSPQRRTRKPDQKAGKKKSIVKSKKA